MLPSSLPLSIPETPGFVYDETAILRTLDCLATVRQRSGARILYSIKALPFTGLLDRVRPRVDGFSASSLFEARLAFEALRRGGEAGVLHITTPGFRAQEMDELAGLCDAISFNSLEQFRRLQPRIAGRTSVGLRVNPRLSFLQDRRYDPCGPYSKLGVPVEDLAGDPGLASRLDGIHFHTLFESHSFAPLAATLEKIEATLGRTMAGLRWINLGGGYWFENAEGVAALAGLIRAFRGRHGVEIFLEPGKAIVGPAGYLVASVIDRFERDGKAIAVLDTGVHHLPEVFEYQKSPRLAGHRPDGRFPCLLAGCTCLAGDVFGDYRFGEPPAVGDRMVFENVGAYALAKANRFNGYDLPAIYALGPDGRVRLMKRYGFEEYRWQWTAEDARLAPGGRTT